MHQKDGDSDASSHVPPTGALARARGAAAHCENFAPSRQREYIEWISEAKGEATRQRRLATAVEWIAQAKIRHWKYQKR